MTMLMRKTGEKRQDDRVGVKLPVRYSYFLSPRLKPLPVTKNISGKGLCLVLAKPLRPGRKIRTEIYFSADPEPVSCSSEVVWCRKLSGSSDAGYEAGIRHVSIEPKDRERFMMLFCETMVNYFSDLQQLAVAQIQ